MCSKEEEEDFCSEWCKHGLKVFLIVADLILTVSCLCYTVELYAGMQQISYVTFQTNRPLMFLLKMQCHFFGDMS